MAKATIENILIKNVSIRKGAGLDQIDGLGKPGLNGMRLNLTFPGYERDPRELFEIQEVREWFTEFLLYHSSWLPQLTRVSFSVAETCCNIARKSTKGHEQVEMQLTQIWVEKCKEVGIDPLTYVPSGP